MAHLVTNDFSAQNEIGTVGRRTKTVAKLRILLDVPFPRPYREEPLELQLQCLPAQCLKDRREGSVGELEAIVSQDRARKAMPPHTLNSS